MSPSLADYFRVQAEWRERKAEEYPGDKRNAESAAALRDLADFVEPVAVRGRREVLQPGVEALMPHLFAVGMLGGERAKRAVSRYGYDHPQPPSLREQFLSDLHRLCVEDAYEYASEHGEDPTGDLEPAELAAARENTLIGESYFRERPGLISRQRQEAIETWRTAQGDGEGER